MLIKRTSATKNNVYWKFMEKIYYDGIKSFDRRIIFFFFYERVEKRINFGWSIAIHKYFMTYFIV